MGEFQDDRFMGEFEVGNDDVLEAKAHDPCVLPHHYGTVAIDDLFPQVHPGDQIEEEFPDFEPDQSCSYL